VPVPASAHGVLVVDKPSGPTSHDVVARARKALGTREVGHAGTLDPLATGVLVLGVREGCKALRYLTLDDKRYDAFLQLGSETDTLDSEGQVTARVEVPAGLALADVARAAVAFVGEHDQAPPAYSAIKQDGVPHHVRARRGEALELAPRRVVLHAVEISALRETTVELSLHCASGFYVRSFARDLARALGTVGHLTALRRTQSGAYRVESAVPYAEIEAAARGDQDARARLNVAVLPIPQALAHVPALVLDDAGAQHARHGRVIPLGCVLAGGASGVAAGMEPVLLLSEGRVPLALGRVEEGGVRVVRGLRVE
jgi:tRNA pseudouridine55 synthase